MCGILNLGLCLCRAAFLVRRSAHSLPIWAGIQANWIENPKFDNVWNFHLIRGMRLAQLFARRAERAFKTLMESMKIVALQFSEFSTRISD